MPLREEIAKVKRGERVRPPREWFTAMRRRVKKQYPRLADLRPEARKLGYERGISLITAGIWHGYSRATQLKLLRRYLRRRRDGNPNSNPDGKTLGSLKRAWRGFKISIVKGETTRARRYANVINRLRAKIGQKPIKFRRL